MADIRTQFEKKRPKIRHILIFFRIWVFGGGIFHNFFWEGGGGIFHIISIQNGDT